jgi:aspartyl-tRNA(Asn)/glutamyl-tRNA(Gln) amidotransferase subunit A
MNEAAFTIKAAREKLASKELSAVELVNHVLERIKKYDAQINSFITLAEDEALTAAKQSDTQSLDRPLEGIPIALKDLYVTQGLRTTAGSKVLENYVPQYDATVVKKLKEAGAIIIGKLNQDAWGHGGSSENSQFGVVHNPWDLERTAGGSSSGSGAAVAAGFCLAAGGTDTGGSIRCPADFCGVVGLKPTYGRVSRYGIVAMASSLDTIGHIGQTVWDVARWAEVTAGHDPSDATSLTQPVPTYTQLLNEGTFSLKGLKVGLPKEYFTKGIHRETKAAVEAMAKILEDKGAEIIEVTLPHTEYGIAVYYVLMPSEVSSNLARYDGIRYGNDRSFFGDEAKRRIMIGTYALSAGYYDAYYKRAMQVRTLIRKDFESAFKKVDLLLTPTSPEPAFKFGEKSTPLSLYLADIFVAPASLAGVPALTLPCGFTKGGLPIGAQLIGPQLCEDKLFQVGHAYQQLTEWHRRKPSLANSK